MDQQEQGESIADEKTERRDEEYRYGDRHRDEQDEEEHEHPEHHAPEHLPLAATLHVRQAPEAPGHVPDKYQRREIAEEECADELPFSSREQKAADHQRRKPKGNREALHEDR